MKVLIVSLYAGDAYCCVNNGSFINNGYSNIVVEEFQLSLDAR